MLSDGEQIGFFDVTLEKRVANSMLLFKTQFIISLRRIRRGVRNVYLVQSGIEYSVK